MELIHPFHFLRPLWLLALPVLWGIAFWLARRQARDGDWVGIVDPELVAALRLDGGDRPSRTPWPWLALAWTLAAIALAGPSWERAPTPAFRGNGAWVLVLDLSPSMQASDISPNRATRARYALDDLLDAAKDSRVGLVVFSDEAYTVTPMTEDIATIRALLPPLKPDIMPSAGDDLAPALERAGRLLAGIGAKNGRVVVLTDGFADPAAAFGDAEKLRAKGDEVDVIGIGTEGGAPVDKDGGSFAKNAHGAIDLARLDTGRLEQLAHSGGGSYVDLAGLPSLIGHLRAAGATLGSTRAGHDVRVAHWLDGGVWLLPFLLLFAALLGRRGWL